MVPGATLWGTSPLRVAYCAFDDPRPTLGDRAGHMERPMPVYGFTQADTHLILEADNPDAARQEAAEEGGRWEGVEPVLLPDQLIPFFGFDKDRKKVVTAKVVVIPG
jgi:hypothetical protein